MFPHDYYWQHTKDNQSKAETPDLNEKWKRPVIHVKLILSWKMDSNSDFEWISRSRVVQRVRVTLSLTNGCDEQLNWWSKYWWNLYYESNSQAHLNFLSSWLTPLVFHFQHRRRPCSLQWPIVSAIPLVARSLVSSQKVIIRDVTLEPYCLNILRPSYRLSTSLSQKILVAMKTIVVMSSCVYLFILGQPGNTLQWNLDALFWKSDFLAIKSLSVLWESSQLMCPEDNCMLLKSMSCRNEASSLHLAHEVERRCVERGQLRTSIPSVRLQHMQSCRMILDKEVASLFLCCAMITCHPHCVRSQWVQVKDNVIGSEVVGVCKETGVGEGRIISARLPAAVQQQWRVS